MLKTHENPIKCFSLIILVYKVVINKSFGFYYRCLILSFCQEKSKKTPNTPRQKGFDEKKIKIAKENTDVNKSSNQRKCTKSDQRNIKTT